ncbi:MAG: hypothetical protein KDJ68_12675, partial [Rhodobiaceae bacterium]|nr:hypothetical protein [Rhodobiaceae bacterium]
EIIDGGYWLREPAEGARLAVCYTGVVAPEAAFAMAEILRKVPDAGLFAVTSADRLNAGWQAAQGARRAGRADAMSPVE